MTCGFLIQLVFCKKKTVWFIGVEVEQETSASPPKNNPGSAPGSCLRLLISVLVFRWLVASVRLRKSKLPADRSHVVIPKHSPTPSLTCFYSHGQLTQTCTALAINNVAK